MRRTHLKTIKYRSRTHARFPGWSPARLLTHLMQLQAALVGLFHAEGCEQRAHDTAYCGGCVRPRVSRETLCWGCAGSQRPPIPVILIRAARIWRGTLKFRQKRTTAPPHAYPHLRGAFCQGSTDRGYTGSD